MGYGLWVMGYGLWVMSITEFFLTFIDCEFQDR
jgi:hypothetical protein